MRLFYRFLLRWTQFDLAIARSTGRSTHYVAVLLADEAKWERAIWNIDHPLHIN